MAFVGDGATGVGGGLVPVAGGGASWARRLGATGGAAGGLGRAARGGDGRRRWRASNVWVAAAVAEPPELFQLKCLSPTLKARPHLNRNKTSVPRI
jgi:hypothetical protein